MSAKSRKTREAAAADHQAESPSAIPWPEWTDAELNAEKWDTPKNGADGHFLDPEPRLMPPSIEPHDWKRGSSLRNLSSNPVVFTPSNESPDFVKNNSHILHSQFVRWFISTMINLQYVGRNGLQVEMDSPNFAWLGKSPWQGWMYVYSMNKVGNSASQHRPVVNPNGKYVVRLFFMGSWRRVVVDDMIPVNKDDSPLLPRTGKDFELWPMLLAKAMMKLAALSWTGQREIADFYPVSCLTGWICLPLDTRFLSESEKWRLLISYVDREDEAEIQTREQSAEDKKTQGPPRPTVAIFANLSNEEEAVDPDVTRCLNHPVYIDKLKDMTVDKSQANNRWKLYRYFDWASKHGGVVGSRTGPGPAIRSLKLIVPLERYGAEEIFADSAEEIGVWTDFRKIAPYLDEISMFYKPSDFEYYTRVSDVLKITSADSQLHVSAAGSRVKSQATAVKDGKKTQTGSGTFQSSVKWQRNISDPTNGPLYMLIDSVDAKFVLVEFCAPNPGSARSYSIFEEHNFFQKSTDDDPAVSVKTASTGATIFEAGPGRHLYRVLFRPGHSYFVRILSDTIFHVGDRFRMYELMGSESDRVDAIAKNISDRIAAAIQQFGKPGYAEELRALYDSYMPPGSEEKRLAKSVHRLFIAELEKVIKETFSDVESKAVCRSLRVFFVDPSIGVRSAVDRIEKYDPAEFSIAEKAAVRIQSFFRMALVKIYKDIHDPSHIGHSAILQSLRRVVELFDYSKRESIATFLIRRIIWSTCTQGQSQLYPCLGDLGQVLNVEEWRGVVKNVQPGQWVPILRAIVNAPSENATVYAGIDFATSLPRYVIRVVNNETYREVKRFVTKVATAHYPYVRLGYTVIGYGWSDGYKSKELGWCVRVTTVKGRPTFRQMSGSKSLSFGTKPPGIVVHELSNNYVPNLWNIIGKWILTVSIDSLVSFRLSTSYDMVESEIKIYDKHGEVLCQASGGSVLILPVAYLPSIPKRASGEGAGDDSRARNRSKSSISDSAKNREDPTTEYFLQVYVTNDSWPLTSAEWTVVNDLRARGTVYDPSYARTSVSSVSKRSTRIRAQNLHGDGDVTSDGTSHTIFQNPLCRLQVLVDAGAKVHIEEDRRREIEISGMKRVWEDAEPGRLLRGRELREEFRESNSSVSEELRSSGDFDSGEIRTLKPWANLSRVLPPWNETTHVSKEEEDDEEDERWVKTEGDEEMLRNQRAINSLDFHQSQAVYMEEEIALLQERRKRYSDLWNSYVQKLCDWNSLADAVCQKREDYVADVKASMSNGAGNKNKNKKKKK